MQLNGTASGQIALYFKPKYHNTCISFLQTKKSNFWVLPKICDGGAPLPKAGEEKDCPPCNPGQFKNGSSCSFCDSDKFSDGKNGK